MGTRIKWLDGLKGVACLIVLWSHFFVGFLPASYYGDVGMSHMQNQWDVALAQSPLAVVLNGNFMVAIFCVASGLVISMQVMRMTRREKLAEVVLKRYPRLMLPVVPVVLVVFFLLNAGKFTNLSAVPLTYSPWLGAYYLDKVSVETMLRSLFFSIWFSGDSTFSNAFWMLSQLFAGTFIAILLSVLTWRKEADTEILKNVVRGGMTQKKRLLVIYAFCAVLYLQFNDFRMAFVLGVILAFFMCEKPFYAGNGIRCIVGIICTAAGIFLGGYPSGVVPTNIYRFVSFFPERIVQYTFWHTIGAALLIYGIWNLRILQRLLECRFMQFLGKISYSIYLIHIPILFSISTSIFLKLMEKSNAYLRNIGIVFILTNVMCILGAWLYYKFVECNCGKLTQKLCAVFLKEK